MTWKVPEMPRRRTPSEMRAFVQGFRSAAGMAVNRERDGKSLETLLDMAALLEEHVQQAEDDSQSDDEDH